MFFMLKKLILKNFQCHKSLKVDFDPCVTILVGKNDSGKTSVTRGLSYLTFNRPLGSAFIRHGQDKCSLQLFLEQHRLKRVVGKNGYYSLDGKKSKAIGKGKIPPDIEKILNLKEINFQTQHSPLGWFALTPGNVAKELNKLLDLESIDKVQFEIAKRLRNKKAELEVTKKRLEDAKQEIKRFKPVVGLNVKLGNLDLRQNDIALKSSTADSLTFKLKQLSGAINQANSTTAAAASGSLAVDFGGDLLQCQTRLDSLALLGGQLRQSESLLSVPIPQLPEWPQPNQADKLRVLIKKVFILNSNYKQLEKSIQEKNEEMEEKLGGRCYACGGILTDRSLI